MPTPAFDKRVFEKVDSMALARSNKDNRGDWFWSFRRGIIGLCNRMYGARRHRDAMFAEHTILSFKEEELEYHIAGLLFNLDSAFECSVFTTNALGFSAAPQAFLATNDANQLRNIRPELVLGSPKPQKRRLHQKGFQTYFPRYCRVVQANTQLLRVVCDNHDVSKHRQAVSVRAKVGWYKRGRVVQAETLGNVLLRSFKLKSIWLSASPKSAAGPPPDLKVGIESTYARFVKFMNALGHAIFEDVRHLPT